MSRLNDREMLLMAYGALKATSGKTKVVEMIEEHLWPDHVKSAPKEEQPS